MTGLSVLGISAFDGKQPTVEVYGSPTQLENLASPESGVHGEQDSGRQVIAKVREQRQ